jgi:single-stranded-DNA-specific exonuclease
MLKTWNFLPQPAPADVETLASAVNINFNLASMLWQRGIHNFDAAKSFFRPSLSDLHDPFAMKDMDVAVTRIIQALENKERILIYGDYDVDGTTSVAMMISLLREHHDQLEFYVPDRYSEGYGVSIAGVDWAREKNVDLMISLDCGIKAFAAIDHARDLGIDFIVCDHHNPGDELPGAVAVLDPKRTDCKYPFKELSGCGVGFKLLQALSDTLAWPDAPLWDLLDLVATSIAADIVPITGENRVLAYFGMKKINADPRIGLQALIKVGALRTPLKITNVVFGIAPRINAAGRITHANGAVELLISQDMAEAEYMAGMINSNNQIRRDTDQDITSEALEMIKTHETLSTASSTVLFKEDWHKGVIGIVASKCIEHFHRPTIILTESNGKATGSARSVRGFDIHEAIGACSELLEQFGGHKYAAGLTMSLDNVTPFIEKFEAVVSATITTEQLTPKIDIDQEVKLDQIDYKFLNIINQMEPFGPGNMSPVFVARNLKALKPKLLKELHLKMTVCQKDDGVVFDAIGFNMNFYFQQIANGEFFDMAFTIEENNFRGVKSIQLNIKDLMFEQMSRV